MVPFFLLSSCGCDDDREEEEYSQFTWNILPITDESARTTLIMKKALICLSECTHEEEVISLHDARVNGVSTNRMGAVIVVWVPCESVKQNSVGPVPWVFGCIKNVDPYLCMLEEAEVFSMRKDTLWF